MTDHIEMTTALAHGIAAELSKLRDEIWTAHPGWHSAQRKLLGPDGAEVLVATNGVQYPGRVSVHGSFPRTNRSLGHHESISVGTSRGAAAIAKEISRRLLPAYLETLAEVRKYNESERAQYVARGVLMHKLAILAGKTYHQEPYEAGRSNTYRDNMSHSLPNGLRWSVEAYGSPHTVSLELGNVPQELALLILAELNQVKE